MDELQSSYEELLTALQAALSTQRPAAGPSVGNPVLTLSEARTRYLAALESYQQQLSSMEEHASLPGKPLPARRPLPEDHELFTDGNMARGLYAEQMMLEETEHMQAQALNQADDDRPSLAELSWEPEAFTCSQCDAVLYSHHLLDLHLLELHDAFFEAQAARRQPVYQCLVEGCPKLCTSVGHRRQHLVDAHQFPSNYDFSRMHLMLHGGQLRPQEQFQRGKAQRMPARLQAEPSSLHKPANQLADEAQSHEGLAAAEPLQQAHGHQEGRHAEQNQPASSPGAGGQLPSEADEVGQLAEEIARLETGSDRGSGRRGRGRGSTRGRWFGVQQRGR